MHRGAEGHYLLALPVSLHYDVLLGIRGLTAVSMLAAWHFAMTVGRTWLQGLPLRNTSVLAAVDRKSADTNFRSRSLTSIFSVEGFSKIYIP